MAGKTVKEKHRIGKRNAITGRKRASIRLTGGRLRPVGEAGASAGGNGRQEELERQVKAHGQ